MCTQSGVHGIFLVCCSFVFDPWNKLVFAILMYFCHMYVGGVVLLDFHVVLETSFVETRVLFRVLCSGVSVSLFGLCEELMETVLQLVILVAVVIVGPGCVRLVRSIIFVAKFSHAWRNLCSPSGLLELFHVFGMICHTGRYGYH